MKQLLLILTLSIVIGAFGGIRNDFHKKEISESELTRIIENTSYPKNALTKAYKGICQTMMAEHVFLPSTKISYFNKGKKNIDEAISNYPSHCELRYIRMLVQLNAPGFLGYNKEIEDDFDVFTKELLSYKTTSYWKKKFIDGLLGSKHIEDDQVDKLKKLKSKIQ